MDGPGRRVADYADGDGVVRPDAASSSTTSRDLGIDVLVTIGGDDTLSYLAGPGRTPASRSSRSPRRWTTTSRAPSTASASRPRSPGPRRLINRQRTTLGSHERIGVFRIFGRDAGFSALYTAYVTSARCVIPEAPYDLDALAELLAADHARQPEPLRVRHHRRGRDLAGRPDGRRRRRRRVRPSPQGERRRGAGGRAARADRDRDARLRADLRPPAAASRTRSTRWWRRPSPTSRWTSIRDGVDRPDGGDPGRQVRPRVTARDRPAAAPGRRRRCTTWTRFRPRYDARARRPDAAPPSLGPRSTEAVARRSRLARRGPTARGSPGRGPTCRRRRGRARRGRSRAARRARRPAASRRAARARSRAIAEVLAVERDLEPERVVVVEHPAAAVGEDPALGRAAAERPDDLLDVEAGLDARGRSPRRRRGRSPARMTWLTALTAWPAPIGPTWVIVLPIASRTGRARSTSAALAADEDRQGRLLGALAAARDRRVDDADAALARGARRSPGVADGRDRRAVDDEAAGRERPSATPSGAEQDRLDVGRVRDADDDDVRRPRPTSAGESRLADAERRRAPAPGRASGSRP